MSVKVTTTTETIQHDSADAWHVDDLGILHVMQEGDKAGPVATYATGLWKSVVIVDGFLSAREDEGESRPRVFRHFVTPGDGVLKTAECGKVWRLNAEASVWVVGDCPTCVEIVTTRWSA